MALAAGRLRHRVRIEEQVTALSSVAPSLSASELSDLALVIAAFKSIDTPKAAEMVARLEPLAAPGRPFGLSVRELQAMLAVRKGDTKRAKELWNEIAKDPAVPQGTSQRVTAMLNLHGGAEAR